MPRGRRPIPENMKKQKLTLSCKRENIDFLNTYCNTCGISISELLDRYAEDLQIQLAKERAKAERAAKKAAKANEQLPGQMSVDDI